MESTIFRGCVPALMTPCRPDRTPNYPALVNKAQKLMRTFRTSRLHYGVIFMGCRFVTDRRPWLGFRGVGGVDGGGA